MTLHRILGENSKRANQSFDFILAPSFWDDFHVSSNNNTFFFLTSYSFEIKLCPMKKKTSLSRRSTLLRQRKVSTGHTRKKPRRFRFFKFNKLDNRFNCTIQNRSIIVHFFTQNPVEGHNCKYIFEGSFPPFFPQASRRNKKLFHYFSLCSKNNHDTNTFSIHTDRLRQDI